MDPDGDLNPDTNDLPLRANTNHILVRHYVLDLTVHFDSKVISGSIVLFLEPRSGVRTEAGGSQDGFTSKYKEVDALEDGKKELETTTTKVVKMCGDAESIQSSSLWHTTSGGEFTLVLDCCDLDVSKVEEVDVTSVAAMLSRFPEVTSKKSGDVSRKPQAAFIQNLISMPSSQWRQQHQLFSLCGRAPGAQDGSTLQFHRDRWSLQVRKNGVTSPQEFPCALRICYETKPAGGSVRWTKDQDNRVCVYTAGSPINNRALFPCQEPPVAMSTWQATVRAPSECVVLMSGEEQAVPAEDGDTHFLTWNYYVTMPMPASTFTLAVGHWQQVTAEIPPELEKGVRDGTDCGKTAKLGPEYGQWTEAERVSRLGSSSSEVVKGSPLQTGSRDQTTCVDSAFCYSSLEDEGLSVTDYSGMVDDGISCSHGDYPCRFTERSAWSQRVIPHRVFSPACLLQKAQMGVLKLLPQCLAAAHAVLGVHPFPRLDVLIVPAGFSSLGMARPNMEKTGQVSESGSSTVKHALNPEKPFMQVHYLKGYFLLRFLASQVGEQQFIEFFQLFVKKYHGHLILSQDFLQMLLISFPGMERKGLTLGAIHGDWLDQPGIPKWLYERSAVWSQARLVEEVKAEVVKWILLSQSHHGKGRKRKRMEPKVNYKELTSDQLVMLLELLLEESELSVASLRALQRTYSLQNQDAEVRHRWCELVVKHAYAQAYGDVEHFLIHDQAMGVYLYGELMVQEDPEQQALARHCLSLVQGEMDQSARRVVEEMVL
ncbi:aminopeptidase O isoform X3 [Maylandia zebra]|uniref:aminopeptidase O isoform X3 n=1 Tax=Maylandia zebra TaxID=106582 RepID=UPI00403CBA1C